MSVKVEGLTKDFDGLRAVDSLNFELDEGSIWGFIGPNGAGKTTTLRMLATIEQPTAGDAWLRDWSVVQHAEKVRPLLGFMPDFLGTYRNMLVSEYLDFFARAYNLYGSKRRDAIADIVEFTETQSLMQRKVSELSKGMRQRISLARVLIHDPVLLLLDEPAAGLDPQARKDFRELLRLLASNDKTVFISSHILSELEDLVDKVVIINNGRLVYTGAPVHDHHSSEGEFTLSVSVLGDRDSARRVLLEQPGVLEVTNSGSEMMALRMSGDKTAVADVNQALVEAGLQPYEVKTEGKALEKLFLQTTGNGPDE